LRAVIARGVPVDIYFKKTGNWDKTDRASRAQNAPLREDISELESWRAHVLLVPDTHAKVFIIDEYVLFDGTINPMSHVKNKERIHWWVDPDMVREAIAMHGLDICPACFPPFPVFGSDGASLEARAKFVGAVLREFRQARGLSQDELCTLTGSSQRVVSAIENATHNPTIGSINKLCMGLDLVLVPVPWIAFGAFLKILRVFRTRNRVPK
jgi:DNA-binding XRE family transcriptional regulator